MFYGNTAFQITFRIDDVSNAVSNYHYRRDPYLVVEEAYAERRRIMRQGGTRPPPVTVELAAVPPGPPRLRRSLTAPSKPWLVQAQGGVRERRPRRRPVRVWER